MIVPIARLAHGPARSPNSSRGTPHAECNQGGSLTLPDPVFIPDLCHFPRGIIEE